MSFIITAILAFLSFVVALFGFSQIVGSIQYAFVRKPYMTAFTITLWVLLLCAYMFLVVECYGAHKMASYIAIGIGFLLSLRHQKQ